MIQETRRWDDGKGMSRAMRSKEDAQDYRYFPDPDLVPVRIDDEWIERIRRAQPEMREEKIARYQEQFELPLYDAQILTESKHLADIFEEAASISQKPKEVSNWLMVEGMRLLKESEMDAQQLSFSPCHLAALIKLVDDNIINRTVAKTVFEAIVRSDVDPEKFVEEKGLKVVNDADALEKAVTEIIAANPQSVQDYKNGKEKAAGFLVGQTMKAMKGKADPGMVNEFVRKLLNEA